MSEIESKAWYRPYRHIPHFYPGEEKGDFQADGVVNPLLPTYKTSPFFSQTEKAVMGNKPLLNTIESGKLALPDRDAPFELTEVYSSVGEYLFGSTPKQRDTAKKNLRTLVESNFPHGYESLTHFFQLQSKISTPPTSLATLREELSINWERPSNAQVLFLFGRHGFEFESKAREFQKELIPTLQNFFQEDARNIFLMERPLGFSPKMSQLFKDGLVKYHSFVAARIHMLMINQENGINHTEVEVSNFMLHNHADRMIRDTDSPDERYQFATFQTLDKLIQKGYQIEAEFERSISDVNKVGASFEEDKFIDEQWLSTVLERSREREGKTAYQITRLLHDTDSRVEPVRLVVQFGSGHARMSEYLPAHIRPLVTRKMNPTTEALYLQAEKGQITQMELYMRMMRTDRELNDK